MAFRKPKTCNRHNPAASRIASYSTVKNHPSKVAKIRPANYWKNTANRRKFLDQLQTELVTKAQRSLASPYESLYSVTHQMLLKHGSGSLLSYYGGSPARAVMDIYKGEFDFKVWRFDVSPRNYWTQLAKQFSQGDPTAISHVREYLDFIVAEVNRRRGLNLSIDEAKGISTAMVREALGETTVARLSHFGGITILSDVLTNSQSKSMSFGHTPTILTDVSSPEQRRTFLDRIAWKDNRFDISRMYELSTAILRSIGGAHSARLAESLTYSLHCLGQSLNSLYRQSTATMICFEYIEQAWKPWEFIQSPRGWWESLAKASSANGKNNGPMLLDPVAECSMRLYIDDLASKHSIQHQTDWYNLSSDQLGDATLTRLAPLGKLPTVLATLYPNHTWETKLFSKKSKRTNQRSLERRVDKILPNRESMPDGGGASSLTFIYILWVGVFYNYIQQSVLEG